MADSAMLDVNKMKVIDLRKELKSRGLSATGDKTELVARLQAAMSQEESQDDHGDGDINLSSSDEEDIDSEGVLDDDDKSHNDILDDGVDTLTEELALEEQVMPVPDPKPAVIAPQRTLKRKITSETKEISEKTEQNEVKKIVLNRAASISSTTPKVDADEKDDPKPIVITAPTDRVKITAEIDPKTRMEMRAKRFGLPVIMSEAERKEARKQRFAQSSGSTLSSVTPSLNENLGKLKQRAERFGQSVSKIMTDIENKEKLEKRKAKFGTSM